MKTLAEKWQGWAEKSVRGWEKANDGSWSEEQREQGQAEHLGYAAMLEQDAFEHGFKVDWPGLYPTLKKDGRTYYTVEQAADVAEGVTI